MTLPSDPKDGVIESADPPTPPAPPPPAVPPDPQGPIISWEPPSVAGAASVAGAEGYAYAGALIRLGAFVIDQILIAVIALVPLLIISVFTASQAATVPPDVAQTIFAIIYTTTAFVYVVGLWTSRSRATLGMRIASMKIVSANNRTLGIGPAVMRWIGLLYPLTLLSGLTAIWWIASAIGLVWWIILLATVGTSPTKQGLHDRWSGSIVMRRVGAGNAGVIGCLLAAVLFLALPVLAIVSLIFIGGQIQEILSTVGESV